MLAMVSKWSEVSLEPTLTPDIGQDSGVLSLHCVKGRREEDPPCNQLCQV